MEEKISVILVNYNGRAFNDRCISSVMKSSVRECIQIVVVDNASTDGSYEELKEKWGANPQIHILSMDENMGFSAANNEGIRWSIKHNIKFYLLLNNDTEIEPNTIEKMWECQKKTSGIITPKILYDSQRDVIWSAGGDFTAIIKKAFHRGLNKKDIGQYDKSEIVHFANGCALLLSKEIIDSIGLLDERFFLYYEDTEYSMRANRSGIPIWYCADAIVYHRVNGSTKGDEKMETAYYITRNWLLCYKMYLGWRFPVFVLYFIPNRICLALIWGLQKKSEYINAILSAVRDAIKGIGGQYKK